MSYTFRIRFNRAPSATIQSDETEIGLPAPGAGVSLSLRASSLGKALKDAERWALVGEGYETEADAWDAGTRIQDALMLALAELRLGADPGYRASQGAFTKYGLEYFGEQAQARILNDVHGLCVYSSEPKPRFMEFKAIGVIGKNAASFREALSKAISLGRSLSERDVVSSHLFGASFFQPRPMADSCFW